MYRVSTEVDSGIPRKSEFFSELVEFCMQNSAEFRGKKYTEFWNKYRNYCTQKLIQKFQYFVCSGGVSPLWCCRCTLCRVGQSIMDKNGFFNVGPHVLMNLMVALKSSGCCVLDCWLPIYSMKLPFFYHDRQNAWQVLWMYSAAGRSHSAEVKRCRASRLV
jgi:hypothetical protein